MKQILIMGKASLLTKGLYGEGNEFDPKCMHMRPFFIGRGN
jgi:hypothetical protein